MNTATQHAANTPLNGVDTELVNSAINAIQDDPGFGKFVFRSRNQWLDGSLNRSRITAFRGANAEQPHGQPFELDNDEPELLGGNDAAANPVEYILHALAGCLTTTLVYHAAVRGIEINSCVSELEGDIDLRGLFGMDDSVRPGYQAVRVEMRVESSANTATLRELACYSPVYDIVSKSVPVELVIRKV